MNTRKTRATLRPPSSKIRCNFRFADGRRCRMLRHGRRNELCLFHSRELLQLESSAELAAELLALGGNFQNPIAINFVLGKLFAAVATGRMHRRDASTLAYIAQLLLQTIDEKKYQRIRDQYDYRGFTRAVDAKYGRPTGKRSTRSRNAAPSPSASSKSSFVGAGPRTSLDAVPPATPVAATATQSPIAPPGTPISRLAPSPTANPTPTHYPKPANPEFPEPLPDTPWFRELVLSRRKETHHPPDQTKCL